MSLSASLSPPSLTTEAAHGDASGTLLAAPCALSAVLALFAPNMGAMLFKLSEPREVAVLLMLLAVLLIDFFSDFQCAAIRFCELRESMLPVCAVPRR